MSEDEIKEYKEELLLKTKEELVDEVIESRTNSSFWMNKERETKEEFIEFIKKVAKASDFSKFIDYSEHDYVSALKNIFQLAYGECVSKKVKR